MLNHFEPVKPYGLTKIHLHYYCTW